MLLVAMPVYTLPFLQIFHGIESVAVDEIVDVQNEVEQPVSLLLVGVAMV